MTKFDLAVTGALVALMTLAAATMKQPGEAAPAAASTYVPDMPPHTTFPIAEEGDGRQPLDVLTKPRYQDVPALNRTILPVCAYQEAGCTE